MFTIYYNKKLTNLQLKIYNYLSKEHNPLVEFLISVLYSILEKSIRLTETIKDIALIPFKVLGFLIMLLFLVLFHLASINRITIPTNTAFINSTVINNITETNFKSHITNIINAIDNIPPPLPIKEEIQPNKAVKIENEIKVVEEKVIDEIESIINPFVKEAVKKKREQLETLDNFKGTLLDIEKIKSCAVDLTIPNNSKPITFYCGNRFCPTCANIKATKNADIIKKVLFKARENKKVLLYGTFTTRNVTADNLTAEIEKINTAFTKTLTIPKKMKENIAGYVRKLEIKYNPINNDYNVHIHTALAVINYYKNHITVKEFHDYFKKYLKDDDIIEPNIQKIGKTDKDIIKVANYISKEDLIQNMSYTDEVSDNIYNAVKNRRILEFCLDFRQLKKEVENVIDLNKLNKYKNKMPILTNLTWDNNKKIYIN